MQFFLTLSAKKFQQIYLFININTLLSPLTKSNEKFNASWSDNNSNIRPHADEPRHRQPPTLSPEANVVLHNKLQTNKQISTSKQNRERKR